MPPTVCPFLNGWDHRPRPHDLGVLNSGDFKERGIRHRWPAVIQADSHGASGHGTGASGTTLVCDTACSPSRTRADLRLSLLRRGSRGHRPRGSTCCLHAALLAHYAGRGGARLSINERRRCVEWSGSTSLRTPASSKLRVGQDCPGRGDVMGAADRLHVRLVLSDTGQRRSCGFAALDGVYALHSERRPPRGWVAPESSVMLELVCSANRACGCSLAFRGKTGGLGHGQAG